MLLEGVQKDLYRHCENRLDALRKRTKGIRVNWDALPFEDRHAQLVPLITSLTNEVFANEFLQHQVGTHDWELSLEDRECLPPLAIQRMESSIAKRTNVLWPWLLFENEDGQKTVDDFLENYIQIAKLIGLFPLPQKVEDAPQQRTLHPNHRTLAATLLFIKDCIKEKDLEKASLNFLTLITTPHQDFTQIPIQQLQSVLIAKANLTEQDITILIDEGIWMNSEDLAMMLIDRGLRDTMINYYGVFRSITCGYRYGQHITNLTPTLRDISTQVFRVG